MKLFLKNEKSGYDAVCEIRDNEFIVLKNSKIRAIHSDFKLAKSVLEARNNSDVVDKKLTTKKDVSFSSASTAAQFVVAQSVNGNRVWKKEDGSLYKKNKRSK